MSYISIKQQYISALVSGNKRKWRNEELHDLNRPHHIVINGKSALCLMKYLSTNGV
jgi:hypothetical protein